MGNLQDIQVVRTGGEPAEKEWVDFPDRSSDYRHGKRLSESTPKNPRSFCLSGLNVAVWYYANEEVEVIVANPLDENETWSFCGPLPDNMTYDELMRGLSSSWSSVPDRLGPIIKAKLQLFNPLKGEVDEKNPLHLEDSAFEQPENPSSSDRSIQRSRGRLLIRTFFHIFLSKETSLPLSKDPDVATRRAQWSAVRKVIQEQEFLNLAINYLYKVEGINTTSPLSGRMQDLQQQDELVRLLNEDAKFKAGMTKKDETQPTAQCTCSNPPSQTSKEETQKDSPEEDGLAEELSKVYMLINMTSTETDPPKDGQQKQKEEPTSPQVEVNDEVNDDSENQTE